MKKPRRDELWDRTPGGLIVPRRPTLPTRRFIQKWGQVQDCCSAPGCEPIWDGSRPASISVSIEGVTNGTCVGCDAHNTSAEIDYSLSGANTEWGFACYDGFAGFGFNVTFFRISETEWIVTVTHTAPTACSNKPVPGSSVYVSAGATVYSSPFSSGTYVQNLNFWAPPGGCVGGSATVVVP